MCNGEVVERTESAMMVKQLLSGSVWMGVQIEEGEL
jgi:hypothetical protein